MVRFVNRQDTERTPLLRPQATAQSASCGPSKDAIASCDVFNTILMIRQDVIRHIDTPVTWHGLTEPALAFNLVRPLTEKYISLSNLSIIYCLLSNRLQFLHDSANLPNARLNTSRAALCELLAIRVITHYAKPTSPVEPDSTASYAFPNLALPDSALPTPAKAPAPVRPSESPTDRQRRLSSSARSIAVAGARQRRMSMGLGVIAPNTPMAFGSGAGEGFLAAGPQRPSTLQASRAQASFMSRKRSDELALANMLIAGFHPFAGAPKEVVDEEEMEGRRGGGRACNALELAIVTESKRFVSCVACQKVLESVWSGRIYYTPSAFFDIVPDRLYKQKAITIYDCRKAPLLDHYRLRVPRYRMLLEMMAFAVVFVLMIIVSNQKSVERATGWEIALMVYALGWAFDRFATTLEHGLRVYAANLWNGIDAVIILVYLIYFFLRIYGLASGSHEINDFALSVLSCESALLFPRLAFTIMKKNVLVMSLRAMLSQFGVLMFAAVWIFIGFWHALYTLDEGNYTVWDIAKYMTNIWFGLDSSGFDKSPRFHPQLGPVIFFIFACLANTLFLTVVVAILSHTFAELNQDAKAEYMFRHAVAIVEGVKSDALFSYQPPINLLALFTLGPASWILSPRAFHKTHVFFTRLFNAPILLGITIFERVRRYLSLRPALTETFQRALPKKIQDISLFMSGAHGDVYAVFDYAVDTLHEDKLRGDDARWSEQGDGDEEQALGDSTSDGEHDDDQSDNGTEDKGSPTSAKSRASVPAPLVARAHRHSESVPIPPTRHRPSHSIGGKSFPRSRTLPVTSPIPAAALHAMDTHSHHPGGMTSGGILASSPEKRFDPLRPPQLRSLMFERRSERNGRRASYPPEEPPQLEHAASEPVQPQMQMQAQTQTESPRPILERGRSSEVRQSSPVPITDAVQRPSSMAGGAASADNTNGQGAEAPAWAAALLGSLSRLEARQVRLEEMLMPSEGD